jgi:hypothetical protein
MLAISRTVAEAPVGLQALDSLLLNAIKRAHVLEQEILGKRHLRLCSYLEISNGSLPEFSVRAYARGSRIWEIH